MLNTFVLAERKIIFLLKVMPIVKVPFPLGKQFGQAWLTGSFHIPLVTYSLILIWVLGVAGRQDRILLHGAPPTASVNLIPGSHRPFPSRLPSSEGGALIFFLEVRKPRHRKVRQLTHFLAATKWGHQASNQGWTPQSILLLLIICPC